MRITLNKRRWIGGFLGPQILGGFLKKKPNVPSFTPISAQAEQQRAVRGNTEALPLLTQLATGVNEQQQNAILQGLERAIPGAGGILKQGGRYVADLLAGLIPADVQRQIQSNAAASVLGRGTYASPNMRQNLVARDLGLTSLGLMQQGFGAAERWLNVGRQLTPSFDITSMFVTPQQQIALAQQQQEAQFQRNWLSSQIKAAYAPGTIVGEAIIKTDDQIMQMASSVLGAAAGGIVCWVAREVYGESNPKWKLFREWLCTKAPTWFFVFYCRFGQQIAAWLKTRPMLKAIVRRWMDSRIYGMV